MLVRLLHFIRNDGFTSFAMTHYTLSHCEKINGPL